MNAAEIEAIRRLEEAIVGFWAMNGEAIDLPEDPENPGTLEQRINRCAEEIENFG